MQILPHIIYTVSYTATHTYRSNLATYSHTDSYFTQTVIFRQGYRTPVYELHGESDHKLFLMTQIGLMPYAGRSIALTNLNLVINYIHETSNTT